MQTSSQAVAVESGVRSNTRVRLEYSVLLVKMPLI